MSKQVQRIRLGGWLDSASVAVALSPHFSSLVWLDSGIDATTGSSYLSGTNLPPANFSVGDEASVFDRLTMQLRATAEADVSSIPPGHFCLGWIGWFGYELAAQTTGVAISASDYPDASFVFVNWAIEFDHETSTCWYLGIGEYSQVEEQAKAFYEAHKQLPTDQVPLPPRVSSIHWRHNPQHYKELIKKCIDAIAQGDAYQLCLTNSIDIPGSFNPLMTYLRLRKANPSHHGGLLQLGEVSLLSSSPEVFLQVSASGKILTKPIKGTRPRGASIQADAELAEELVQSEKERAENLMIVDLMRNDLGKVAKLGTVQVEDLLAVETYESVHQLVSSVTAELDAGKTAIDVITASFPAGSMTGAPKLSAMNILHELEQGPRGIYSGAFGYIGLNGEVDLAMVIRSIILNESGARIGTGGGITAGSDPEAELEETFVKVEPLLKALGVDSTRYSGEDV